MAPLPDLNRIALAQTAARQGGFSRKRAIFSGPLVSGATFEKKPIMIFPDSDFHSTTCILKISRALVLSRSIECCLLRI